MGTREGSLLESRKGQVDENSLQLAAFETLIFHARTCARARFKENETKNCIEDAVEVSGRNKYYTIDQKIDATPFLVRREGKREGRGSKLIFVSFFGSFQFPREKVCALRRTAPFFVFNPRRKAKDDVC
jgi:hypothetical protein